MTSSLEERFEELRQQIMTRLQERGGDTANSKRVHARGIDFTQIANNADKNGWDALYLNADGSWHVRFACDGYPIRNNTSLEDILEEYGDIKNSDVHHLRLKAFEAFKVPDAQSALEEHKKRKTEVATYVKEHRDELLEDLIESMQEALQKLEET